MRAFTIVWFGQFVSLLGTGMTRFALTIWAYQETGQATALALVAFFSFAPAVVLSPVAGALVDRWNRKLVMVISDLAAGLSTVAVLILYLTGNLEVWHLYVTGFIAGVGEPFQFPAFSAAVSVMVPKEQYGRASGMMSLADSASGIAAPFLAGILIALLGISGVLFIDIVTFTFAVLMVVLVHIPQPKTSAEGTEGKGSLWEESIYGFRYILARPSLLGLQLLFFASNFVGSIAIVMLAPMILARTGSNELVLGTVQSALGVGGVVGGLLLSTWGGPKRRIHGLLIGFIGFSLFGDTLMGVGRTLPIWVAAAFLGAAFLPFINGSNQAIWQAKVAPDVQGRVFGVRRLIAQITGPVALLMAGPLADRVFEPALMPGGALVPAFGWLVGVGPGAGMALLMILMGLIGVVVGISGYLVPAIYHAEQRMLDHDGAVSEELAAADIPA